MSKEISFKHNNLNYCNMDINNDEIKQMVLELIGQDSLDKLLAENPAMQDPLTQLQLAVIELYEEVHKHG